MPRLRVFSHGRRLPFRLALAILVAASPLGADESAKRRYELPSGDAAAALRQVSVISGCEILFAAEAVRGVRTNAVRGTYTPVKAVAQLLKGTVLSVVQDEKTGALAVRRKDLPLERSSPPSLGY